MKKNSKNFRNLLLLSALLSVCFTAGCGGGRYEMEERAYVVVLGVDLHPTEEKNTAHMIDITFQIANPQVGSAERGKAENEAPFDMITFTAPDILAASEMANSVIPRKIALTHLSTMIVGEELARSPMLHPIITSFTRDPEARRDIYLIITKERASDFIHKNRPTLETRPHKYYAFMQERWKDTGHVPNATINRYMQRLHGELFLVPYATEERHEKVAEAPGTLKAGELPQKFGDPVQMAGSAVLKNGKMIGTMTLEETRIATLLRRKRENQWLLMTIPDPLAEKYRIVIRLLKTKNVHVKINTKKEIMEIRTTIPLKAQILSIPSLTDYIYNTENQAILKKAIERHLSVETDKLNERTQHEFKAEPYLWQLAARKNFWTWKEFEQYQFEEKYPHAHIEVTYHVEIEGFGKQFKPQKRSEITEKEG